MELDIDATFDEKVTCSFKNDMKNLAIFHQIMLKSLKRWTLVWSYYSKEKVFELKIDRGVLGHDSEE